MKGAWRALWERRPRLGHKGRAARNLLLVLALAVLVWGQYGCPMPTAEMAFRQMEGQYLLPRSEIVYQSGFWNTGDIERVESRDGTYLSVFDPFVVGVAQNRVYSVTLDRPGRQVLGVFPLGEGPAPIPINGVIAWVPEPGRTRMSGCNLLFLQIQTGHMESFPFYGKGTGLRHQTDFLFIKRIHITHTLDAAFLPIR